MEEKISFDAALKALEERVKQLEDGELPLEDALDCFKEGINLVRVCSSKLKEAETIVRQLTLNEDGTVAETVPELSQDGDSN